MSTALDFQTAKTTGEKMKPKHSPGSNGPTVAVETITPAQAHALLGGNTHNRLVSSRVKDLARAMREGFWVLNGETIKVAKNGTLIDGQHRLLAIIEAKTPIQTYVVRGLPLVAQETVDIGRKRTLGDVLSIRGEANYTILAAALSVAWRLDTSGHLRSGGKLNMQPQHGELLQYLMDNPGITKSVTLGSRVAHELRYPGGTAAGLHYLMAKKRAAEADDFWEGVVTGFGLSVGSPILALRQFLIRDLGTRHRSSGDYRAALAIKAWNAYVGGKSIRIIGWKTTEDFPRIEG